MVFRLDQGSFWEGPRRGGRSVWTGSGYRANNLRIHYEKRPVKLQLDSTTLLVAHWGEKRTKPETSA